MTFFDCTADLVGQLNGNGQKGMLQIDAPPVENFWLRQCINVLFSSPNPTQPNTTQPDPTRSSKCGQRHNIRGTRLKTGLNVAQANITRETARIMITHDKRGK